jgi:hypothetical protein
MGSACSTYEGEERDGQHLKDQGVDRRIILQWIFQKFKEVMD